MSRIRVLIIDDSAVVRKLMSDILSKESDIEVVATALDPYIGAEKIRTLQPDVVTLDIEMPRMDGITFLSKLMLSHPLPVIMVSSFTDNGARETVRALDCGAVDFVLKPGSDDGPDRWDSFGKMLVDKIKIASKAHIARKTHIEKIIPVSQKTHQIGDASDKIIAIGASTGGTEVITRILCEMPQNIPGIVITQHMPPKFTEAFANRINSLAEIEVKEASNGDRVFRGAAYIAPGGMQMSVYRDTMGFWIGVNDDPPVNRHKPSVDVLFNSVSKCTHEDALGIILTGMGADGAVGLRNMRDQGSYTIAQDESSCIVFGMPREALRIGAAVEAKNIEGIISFMKKWE